MFETCDWNDEAGGRSSETAEMCSVPEKVATSRKKRLKRNRQLLEVLRTLNTPSAVNPDLPPPPEATPPKRQKRTAPDVVNRGPPPPEEAPVAQRPLESGERLSRRQWRNKLKNKRRNCNKFKVVSSSVGGMGASAAADRGADGTVNLQRSERRWSGATPAKAGELVPPPSGSSAKGRPMSKTKPLRAGELPTSDAASGQWGKEARPPQQVTPRDKARLQKLKKLMQREAERKATKPASEEDRHDEPEVDNSEAEKDPSAVLRSRMEERLNSARFRFINEQLYTLDSQDAIRLFQRDPEAFTIYHSGFSQQVQRWPANPITEVMKYIKNRPSTLVVADFGCGDALLARSVRNKVHSFDLVALNDHVTVCDMAKVPLPDGSVDVAVFCLSLMGKNLSDFLREANRVLKLGGVLLVAEVSSRFDDVRQFLTAMSHLGFKSVNKSTKNSHFFLFEFSKMRRARDWGGQPGLQLKPCLYKKR